MPKFKYSARNPRGEVVTGILDAENEKALVLKLRQQGLLITSTQEVKDKVSLRRRFVKGVSGRDRLLFTRQLATMVGANLPLDQCLDVLIQQSEEGPMRDVVTQVKQDVERGNTLSEALAKHPRVFSTLYVSMVKSGEASGNLDAILERLFGYLEKANVLIRRVKVALTYPAIVGAAAIVIVGVLIVFIIPKFAEIFAESEIPLPTLTKVLFGLGNFLLKNIFFILILVIGTTGGLYHYFQNTEKGKWERDKLALRLPIIGSLLQKVALSRFTTTLGTLVASGVPILDALEIVSRTAGNRVIEKTLTESRERIRQGEKIGEVLKTSAVFPPLVTQMISVGEQAGALDKMLAKIGEFYDQEVDASVETLTSAIEPLLIIFLGFVVGSIVFAIFLPIFKMGSIATSGG